MEAGEVEADTPHLTDGDGEEIQRGIAGRFRGSLLNGEKGLALLAAR
ncbi:hypothetical protein ACWF9B_25750 [Streptomyces sp. NPDC055089]